MGRTCITCRRVSPLYAVRAATRYEGSIKEVIWHLKFERAQAGAIPLARLLVVRLRLPAEAIVMPVPTSTRRVRQRGYDQTVLIARSLARRTKLPYMQALTRLGKQQQHTASRVQRLTQLATAFQIMRPQMVQGKHIILIDDVITTGATLEAAARTLKAAGAKRVSAAVCAQA